MVYDRDWRSGDSLWIGAWRGSGCAARAETLPVSSVALRRWACAGGGSVLSVVSRTRRLAVVLLLNLGLVVALLVVGVAAHSLAVLAAGADYLADAAAIGVALLAIWLASRPRGSPKAASVAALVNTGWLLTLNVAIAVAAVQHLGVGVRRVAGLPVLVVSAIAAAAMLAGALVLRGDADDGGEELNVKAVLLDTAADGAAAAGAAVSGAIILGAGGWYMLDPATAMVIAVIISSHALRLIGEITVAGRARPAPGRRR